MNGTVRLGISSCLLGNPVRYDGGHKLEPFVRDALGPSVAWVPICPEVEYGLPVPREPLRLVGTPSRPRLLTLRTSVDHTAGMRAWAVRRLDALEREDLCGFVFKSRSPSCGMREVEVFGKTGAPSRSGVGIFARAFRERFPLLPSEEEGRLRDPALRENFMGRVLVFARWREYRREDGSPEGLVAFHAEHKLLLAHGAKHSRTLERLVAKAGKSPKEDLWRRYLETLLEGLRLLVTTHGLTNVLQRPASAARRRGRGPAPPPAA